MAKKLEFLNDLDMLQRVSLKFNLSTITGFLLRVYRRRGFVLRGLICWLMGCLILINDEVSSYDQRLQIRGDQPASNNIIIVNLKISDLDKSNHFREFSESSYWDEAVWSELIKTLLKGQPKSISITAYFPEGIGNTNDPVFKNNVIYWATNSTFRPIGANLTNSNIGNAEFIREDDGFIRRFLSASSDLPHLAEMATNVSLRSGWIPRFLNYRGGERAFTQYSAKDILNKKVRPEAFNQKIILIGIDGLSSFQQQTPLGIMSRTQVIAHICDNLLKNRWILRAPNWGYAALLFFVMILSVFIITQYPQSIALAFLLWLGLLIVSVSVWVFDSYYFWIPLASSISVIVFCWIIFVGYQANKMEKKTWQLEQEQVYLRSLENLKNNFISLISHDLKTPIAKIQSISDRLLTQELKSEVINDLKSLRLSSEELHRYIQSILKVLQVESRDFRLNKETFDINELIEQAVLQLMPLVQEKNLTLITKLEPLFSIEADSTLMREVLVNLIENAIKYTQPGGEIVVISSEESPFLVVEIQDNGHGIPPSDIELVWKKFVRGKDQEMKTKGTGLGLYLVKYFIELHGGKVFLESEINKGTKVTFTLPLENQASEI